MTSVEGTHFEQARTTLDRWAEEPGQVPEVAEVFEAHIFCEPFDPDPETKQRFVRACERVGIKPLCLGLDYEGKGVVNVLQSTRYYESSSPREPVAEMLAAAEALGEEFAVVRLKLEAMARDPGVPQTDEEMRRLCGQSGFEHYFEFHVKLRGEPTPENDEALKALARELTEALGVKVPFSCNNLGRKRQRFLNARTYGLGLEASRELVGRIVDAAAARGFEAQKVIEELIVFDTNKALDRGWLER